MPQEELPELDSEQVSRILLHATASKYLRSRAGLETTAILFEVQLDFGRTMNKIIMDANMNKTEDEMKEMIPGNLTMPPPCPHKEVVSASKSPAVLCQLP